MAMLRPEVLAKRIACVNYAQMWDRVVALHGNEPPNEHFPRSFQRWVEMMVDAETVYGGWMEDRSRLLSRVKYLRKNGTFLHLAVDVSVRAGEEILAPDTGVILHVGTDTPLSGGWGGHVVQRILHKGAPHAVIVAHLGPTLVCAGDIVPKGTPLGTVGTREENGDWGEHVHVQLCTFGDDHIDWQQLMSENGALDGYGKVAELPHLARLYPDPTQLIIA